MTTEETQQGPSLEEDLAARLTETEPEIEAPPEIEETPEEIIEALEAPTMWNKELREAFSHWSEKGEDGTPLYPNGPQWQKGFHELYSTGQAYTTQKEQEAAQLKKQLEPFQQYAHTWNNVLSPYQQLIAETGSTPDQLVRQALGLAQSLKNDPQATLQRLAREANVDLNQIGAQQPYVSETEAKLQNDLAELKRQQAQFQQQQSQSQQQELQARQRQILSDNAQQLQKFVEATGDDGKPAHEYLQPDNPHFAQIESAMSQLIYGRNAQRTQAQRMGQEPPPVMNLHEAYETACKLSPEITQAQAAAQQKAEAARKDAEAKKELAASKRVTGTGAGKSTPEQSLEDAVRANLDKAA